MVYWIAHWLDISLNYAVEKNCFLSLTNEMMSMDICHDSAYDENKFLFHNSKYEDSLILNSFVSE